jgi:hypothetical protein
MVIFVFIKSKQSSLIDYNEKFRNIIINSKFTICLKINLTHSVLWTVCFSNLCVENVLSGVDVKTGNM